VSPKRIAYQGTAGAFGEEAALMLWPRAEPVGKPSFEDVVQAVQSGEVDAGVLPVSNRIIGPVERAVAALERAERIELAGTVDVPVRLHLLGVPGARLAQVERIAGHPIALAQCRGLLGVFAATVEEWYDSAAAARAVREAGDSRFAAIAGEAAASRYGLAILRADVHDRPDNSTRFVGLRRRP